MVVVQVARDKLVSLGTPIGKLTHSGKFRLTVGALDVLSRYAKHKVGDQQPVGFVWGQMGACQPLSLCAVGVVG